MEYNKTCKWEGCAKPFVTTRPWQDYCCPACKRKSDLDRAAKKRRIKKQNSVVYTKVCANPECGCTFETKNVHQIYCDVPCRNKANLILRRTTEKTIAKRLSLTEINAKARSLGMSYGQYKAMQLAESLRVEI